jgi:hypothetical protein
LATGALSAADTPAATPTPSPFESVPEGVRRLQGPPVSVAPENSVFQVEAPDLPSAHQVLDMAEHARTILALYFTWPEKPPSRIRIQLIPAASATFTAPYYIGSGPDGRPTAFVRWSADAQFADLCRAVTGVILQNLVQWQNGKAIAGQMPDWLPLGFGAMLEVTLKPPMIDAYTDRARRYPMLAMSQIMLARDPIGQDIPILAVNAFWLVTFLDNNCANRSVARALFDALADGIAPPRLLATAFPNQSDDPRDLELWWQIGYRDELVQQGGPIQSLAETRALLDKLERVAVTGPNGPEQVRLDEAWPHHADKDLDDAIALTLINEVNMPGHANPAYKNAVVSVLRALEKLRGDSEKDFLDAWKQYQADRAEGETIEKAVGVAMALGN